MAESEEVTLRCEYCGAFSITGSEEDAQAQLDQHMLDHPVPPVETPAGDGVGVGSYAWTGSRVH